MLPPKWQVFIISLVYLEGSISPLMRQPPFFGVLPYNEIRLFTWLCWSRLLSVSCETLTPLFLAYCIRARRSIVFSIWLSIIGSDILSRDFLHFFICPFIIIHLHYFASVFFVYGKLIWVKNTYIFAVKYIYIFVISNFRKCPKTSKGKGRYRCKSQRQHHSRRIGRYFREKEALRSPYPLKFRQKRRRGCRINGNR